MPRRGRARASLRFSKLSGGKIWPKCPRALSSAAKEESMRSARTIAKLAARVCVAIGVSGSKFAVRRSRCQHAWQSRDERHDVESASRELSILLELRTQPRPVA